jgi:hypothetical protein
VHGFAGSGFYSAGYYEIGNFENETTGQYYANGVGTYYGINGFSTPLIGPEPSGSYYATGFAGAGYYATSSYSGGYMGIPGMGGTYIGAGTYYGSHGYSNPQFPPSGSYYASGFAGAGYYANQISFNYYRIIGNWNSYFYETAVLGDGTYYGSSGTSSPVSGLSGSYYSRGFAGSGYYSTGYWSCGYTQPTGMTEWNYYYGPIGNGTFYGFSPNATPIIGPSGFYYPDGFGGAGFYAIASGSYYYGPYGYGQGTYFGTSGYSAGILAPPGSYYTSGYAGTGYYAASNCTGYYYYGTYCNYTLVGSGTFYGISGTSTPQAPPSGSYYGSGYAGSGYYATGSYSMGMGMGSYYGYVGSGTYYGISGYDTPVDQI